MNGLELGIRCQVAGITDQSGNTAARKSSPVARPEDTKALSAARDAAKTDYKAKADKLKKTTQDFEAVFLGMMLKQMRKSVAGQNALFGNSNEAKMYQDMMDDTTAKQLSKVGTFGLAKLLYKTMERTLPPNPDKE